MPNVIQNVMYTKAGPLSKQEEWGMKENQVGFVVMW